MSDYAARAAQVVEAWLGEGAGDEEIDDEGGTLGDFFSVFPESRSDLERRIAEVLRLVDREVTMLERGLDVSA